MVEYNGIPSMNTTTNTTAAVCGSAVHDPFKDIPPRSPCMNDSPAFRGDTTAPKLHVMQADKADATWCNSVVEKVRGPAQRYDVTSEKMAHAKVSTYTPHIPDPDTSMPIVHSDVRNRLDRSWYKETEGRVKQKKLDAKLQKRQETIRAAAFGSPRSKARAAAEGGEGATKQPGGDGVTFGDEVSSSSVGRDGLVTPDYEDGERKEGGGQPATPWSEMASTYTRVHGSSADQDASAVNGRPNTLTGQPFGRCI